MRCVSCSHRSGHGAFPIDGMECGNRGEYLYEIQVLYGGKELCLNIGGENYVYEVSYPAPRIHYLSEREGVPDKLTALCEDAMEQ